MLSTNVRFTQAQDPTGVTAAPCGATTTGPVTVPAYQVTTTIPSLAARLRATRLVPAAGNWTVIETGAMSKVDFHDRWPLHSTS